MKHPYTPIAVAATLMVATTVLNSVWVSAACLCVAVVAGCLCSRWSVLKVVAALAIPACISFSLIYGLFGQWHEAISLSVRFASIVSCGLVFGSFVLADDLMRALQTWLPAPLVFVVGSVVRLLPIARARVATIEQIQRSRGVEIKGLKWASVAMPLVVGLVTDASERSRPLTRSGILEPGRRTTLYPVPDTVGERIFRWVCAVGIVAMCVWALVV